MKNKTRVIIFILCISMLLMGCSAGTNTAKKKTSLKIGICVYDQYDAFISKLVEQFKREAKKKEKETGVTMQIEIAGAGGKQNVQNDQVEKFIESGYDILCVNLVDRTDATMVIDKAKNADVPVIFFNRELVKEDLQRWDKLYYVGSVTSEAGILQGQIVADLCSQKEGMDLYDKNQDGVLQYVMLEGEAGHQDALVRTEYAIKTITEANVPLEKIADEIANWNRAQAQTKMNLWLDEFGDSIELVICNNDDMALGVLDAWKESDRKEWPLIVGIDGMEEALDAIKEGRMNGTVLNDAKGQALGMVELSYSIYFGTALPKNIVLKDEKYIRLPNKIITAENVDEFIE